MKISCISQGFFYLSKIRIRQFLSALVAICVFINSSGQKIILEQSNESGIYRNGENISVTASLKGLSSDSISVSVRENFGGHILKEKFAANDRELQIFKNTYNEPTAVIIEVHGDDEFASLGLVVDPENFFPGAEQPEDFESYWKKEKKALRALPMKVIADAVESVAGGYSCFDVEINCTGPNPARGYFVKPESADRRSLPIVLIVHAAGVKGAWCLSQPENALHYAKMGQGALCFDLNAHGMKNGQPQEYYDKLEDGELKMYFYKGMEDRDTYYFKAMYLRLIRTLDFLTSQPEWDRKRIIVIGESQGGGQALAAAGLDDRVTMAVATVPALCDLGGPLSGRQGGWPNPIGYNMGNDKIRNAVLYFDTAYLLKKSKATLVTEIGYIDITCPSTSIYAAINQSKGKKITFGVPYRGHHLNQTTYQKLWEESVYKPKMDIITNYLK